MSRRVETDAISTSETFNYRAALHAIHMELGSRDVKALKFLCTDLIPVGKMEGITNSLGLFSELEKLSKIQSPNNVAFLAELLCHIGRNDLLRKLMYSTEFVKGIIDSCGYSVSPYR